MYKHLVEQLVLTNIETHTKRMYFYFWKKKTKKPILTVIFLEIIPHREALVMLIPLNCFFKVGFNIDHVKGHTTYNIKQIPKKRTRKKGKKKEAKK